MSSAKGILVIASAIVVLSVTASAWFIAGQYSQEPVKGDVFVM